MNCYEKLENLVSGKRVAVVGVGVSNTPLIYLLLRFGAIVTACDKRSANELGEVYTSLSEKGVVFQLEDDYLKGLDHPVIFKTPGMRFDIPEFEEARKKGSIITSEMEQFFEMCPAKIYGITGSDGKTTTSTVVSELLKEEGYRCWLGGNIGTPLLDKIEEMTKEDRVVLELSSFQLHTMRKSPQVAVITNITPNHLDVHKDYQEYIDAKKNIMLYQNESDVLVTNSKNDITRGIGEEANGEWRCFSSCGNALVHLRNGKIYYDDVPILDVSQIKIPGIHNVENYMAAIAATRDDVSVETVQRVASTFGGVAHRLEFVRERNGVRYYNDSIATTPSRSTAAINAFDCGILLIAGGYDKQIPFDDFGKLVAQKVKKMVVLIDTPSGPLIRDAVKNAPESITEIIEVKTFEEAVDMVARLAEPSDVVLLSTACASFGMFKNYVERGKKFCELVNKLS